MHLIQVDRVDTEPLSGLAAPRRDVAPADRRHNGQKLRSDKGFATAPGDGPTDDPLRLAKAVDLGGVDHVHPEIEGSVHDVDGGRVGVVLAVGPFPGAELPRADSDGRQVLARNVYIAHAFILPHDQ